MDAGIWLLTSDGIFIVIKGVNYISRTFDDFTIVMQFMYGLAVIFIEDKVNVMIYIFI